MYNYVLLNYSHNNIFDLYHYDARRQDCLCPKIIWVKLSNYLPVAFLLLDTSRFARFWHVQTWYMLVTTRKRDYRYSCYN